MKIGNLWCVGRNYADHAKELNNPLPQKPLIFLKASSCANLEKQWDIPKNLGEIHHECELAVQMGAHGEPLKIALALDLTARTLQAEAKKAGEPWTLAKSFKNSCPISPFIDFKGHDIFNSLQFEFSVNDRIVQRGSPQDMIFTLSELLDYIRSHFPWEPGDVVLTGTPAGVGPIRPGDRLSAQILGRLQVTWDVM